MTAVFIMAFSVTPVNKTAIYYNITLRHVCAVIVAVEKQKCHILIVCRLRYSARNAPYCHLWPAQLYDIFSTLSQNRYGFR